MNCNGRRMFFLAVLFAAFGLLWGYTAYAAPIVGPAPSELAQNLACDGVDNDGDGVADDGYEDSDGDGTANCVDNNSDSDGDGLVDSAEDPDGNGYDPGDNCDVINDNTDGVSANDGVGDESAALDTDGDGIRNCADANNDNDGLNDNLEDSNNNGSYDAGGECNLIVANTDGVSANDGVGAEDMSDTDGDLALNCEDTNNDGDAFTDTAEDTNGNGTFEAAADSCNLDAANTDGVSADDGVGAEGTANTDGDGLQNCEDNNNDNDGLTDDLEDSNGNGSYDANGECNLIVANTDVVSANDGVNGEGTADTDSDGALNCEDTNNDNDGHLDNVEDVNSDGLYNPLGECDLNNANTDGVSANDGVGAELRTSDTDSDGLRNCEDPNNDGRGTAPFLDTLTDDLEDTDNNGVFGGADPCNLIASNTDGVSGHDGTPNEGTGNADGAEGADCNDTDNDNDGGDGNGPIGNDASEDDNSNGITDGLECNQNVANSDGQSAEDYVGTENETDQPAPDTDTIRNCQDPDNDGDGLSDGAEDVNSNGVFDGPVGGSNECNLIVVNTDGVNGNDNDPIETMTDTDGDTRPNCNDTDNDNDGLNDTVDPDPNVPGSCNAAVKVKYLTSSVKFTAANQTRTVRVTIRRNTGKPSVRLDNIDATATSPDIVDVTTVSPALPRTITSAVTFSVTVKGPAAGPFPVTVNFPTAEFTPSFPGGVGDGEGADRLDYTFVCGTYIALSEPGRLEEPSTLRLRELRITTSSDFITFEALGAGIKSMNVQLYDTTGRSILEAEAKGSLVNVPLAGERRLSNGVYLYVLTVRGHDGQVVRSGIKKLVLLR